MCLIFQSNKYFLQFIAMIFLLLGLSDICLADLSDLIKYENNYENLDAQLGKNTGRQVIKLPDMYQFAQAVRNPNNNRIKDREGKSFDVSKRLTLPKDLKYPLFLGLCCGKCGGNMPLNIPGGGTPEPHELRVKTNLSWMRMVGLRKNTSSRSVNDALKEYMMVPRKMDMTMGNLSVGYAFSDRFFAGIMGMYANKDMSMHNRAGKKSRMQSQGAGDTMIITKTLLYADDLLIPTNQVSLLLGLSLPTGSIDQDERGGLLPYSMQLGSGTFDPFLGILYEGSRTPFWWGSNISYLARVHENYKSYNLGDQIRFDFYGMYQMRYDLVGELQINGKYVGDIEGQAREIEQGGTGHIMTNPDLPFASNLFDPDNYGGTTIELTAGIQWQPFNNHILNVQFAFPLFQNLNGTQLEKDFNATITYYVEVPLHKSRRLPGKDKGLDILGF
jgi:hypothetical protein